MAMVDELRDADRDVARAMARRLERINDIRLEAEAGDGEPDAAAEGEAADEDEEGARSRVRFRNSPEVDRRALRFEIAAALRISEQAAEAQLAMAEALSTTMTRTLGALRAGEISEWHARLVWDSTMQLQEADRAEFEQRALVAARKLNPPRLKRRLRDIAERLHPETAIERHRKAVDGRDVWLDPLPDGTGVLCIRNDIVKLTAALNLINDSARGIAGDPNETRSLAQLRADTASEFLLNGQLGDLKIVPTAHIVVPALSLAGQSEELAILDGYGPIDLATARKLLDNAEELIRLVTHPVTGTILAVDSYKATKGMRRWLEIRDETCRVPGCGRRAADCELDHTRERAKDNGPTSFDNLAYVCINHHTLKTVTDLDYRHLDQLGTLEWITPFGQTYITEPAQRMRGAPHLADAILQATLNLYDEPQPEFDDHIPDELWNELRALMDAELEADRAAGTLVRM